MKVLHFRLNCGVSSRLYERLPLHCIPGWRMRMRPPPREVNCRFAVQVTAAPACVQEHGNSAQTNAFCQDHRMCCLNHTLRPLDPELCRLPRPQCGAAGGGGSGAPGRFCLLFCWRRAFFVMPMKKRWFRDELVLDRSTRS